MDWEIDASKHRALHTKTGLVVVFTSRWGNWHGKPLNLFAINDSLCDVGIEKAKETVDRLMREAKMEFTRALRL